MAKTKYLITSALPYVNNVPHLGNIVGCVLSADVYARYRQNIGDNVLFLCGTDEYGTATETKALEESSTCQEICDRYYQIHKEIYDWFNIKFDVFGRTTTETQTQLAQEIFLELYKNGYIFEKITEQLYCNTCQRFLADRYIRGYCYTPSCQDNHTKTKGDQCDSCGQPMDPLRLIKPTCIICDNTPISKESNHLFLDLAKFQTKLAKYLQSVSLLNKSQCIAKQWLGTGLHERCITRDLDWGTPVPTPAEYPELAKFAGKVFYVWFDAPIGYFSILMHALGRQKAERDWLKNPDTRLVQFMAKDNVSFHTIMFPATIMGYNENKPTGESFILIQELNCTEYLNYKGGKFSKSQGLGIFGDQAQALSKRLGISSDVWRAYLIFNRPETHDTSFDWDSFVTFNKSFLCDKFGNYVNRVFSLATRFCNSRVLFIQPVNLQTDSVSTNFFNQVNTVADSYDQHLGNGAIRDAFKDFFAIVDLANNWLYKKEPWKVYAQDSISATNVIALGVNMCFVLARMARPFMPQAAHVIIDSVENGDKIVHYEFPQLDQLSVKKPGLLFRPISVSDVESIL